MLVNLTLPLTRHTTWVRLTLPSSKTDPFHKGVSILIARAPAASTCAVPALRHLFLSDPQLLSALLFSDIVASSPLTRNTFIKTLKDHLLARGFNSSKFLGHSFCTGAAPSAALVGYSDYKIQLPSR